jgi:hypothetical protein
LKHVEHIGFSPSKLPSKFNKECTESELSSELLPSSPSSEVGSAKVGSAEVRSSEVESAEVRSAEVRSAEVGSPEVGSAEVRSGEVRSAEVGSAEVRSAEVRSAEVGSAEVGPAEVAAAAVAAAAVATAVADEVASAVEIAAPNVNAPDEARSAEMASDEVHSTEANTPDADSPSLGSLPCVQDAFCTQHLDAATMAGDFANVWEALLYRFAKMSKRQAFHGLQFGGLFVALAKKGWLLWDVDMVFCMLQWDGKEDGLPKAVRHKNCISISNGTKERRFRRSGKSSADFTTAVLVRQRIKAGDGDQWGDSHLRQFWKPFSITNMTDIANTKKRNIPIVRFLEMGKPPTDSCVLIAVRHAFVDLFLVDLRAAAEAEKSTTRDGATRLMTPPAKEDSGEVGLPELSERACLEMHNLLSNAAMKDAISGLLSLGRALRLVTTGAFAPEDNPVLDGGSDQWEADWADLQGEMSAACALAKVETAMVKPCSLNDPFICMHKKTCNFAKVGGRHMAGISGANAVNAPKPLSPTGDFDAGTHSGKQKEHAEQVGYRDNRQHLAEALLGRNTKSRVSSMRKLWRVMIKCRRGGIDPSLDVSHVIREVCVNSKHGGTLHKLSSIPQKEVPSVQYFWRWIARAVWCAVWR